MTISLTLSQGPQARSFTSACFLWERSGSQLPVDLMKKSLPTVLIA